MKLAHFGCVERQYPILASVTDRNNMNHSGIPIVSLDIATSRTDGIHVQSVMSNEIKDIHIESIAISEGLTLDDVIEDGHKAIYLFLHGHGKAIIDAATYPISSETILLPNSARDLQISNNGSTTLHYIKILCHLSEQDQADLQEFPTEHTQQVYYARFSDCQGYTEPIKSANTVSRTILPNQIVPRVAMGTVHTTGPDAVGAHKHPMLEQLFLGLGGNQCTVHADGLTESFNEYDLLHVPLGSLHGVEVSDNHTMYYIWMDFFLHKDGEEWLKTHITQ